MGSMGTNIKCATNYFFLLLLFLAYYKQNEFTNSSPTFVKTFKYCDINN